MINLIDEHKTVSNEIHKLNLIFLWSVGVMAIVLSIIRIILIFVLINLDNDFFANIFLSGGFIILTIFGFGLTYLFSLQIKSTHQSRKLIN